MSSKRDGEKNGLADKELELWKSIVFQADSLVVAFDDLIHAGRIAAKIRGDDDASWRDSPTIKFTQIYGKYITLIYVRR